MIWQYDIRVVVMLTNLVEGSRFTCIKCNKYWPESVGDTKRFGNIEVQLFDKAEVCTPNNPPYP
jgi:protein tyrosine phosphatase